MAHASKQDRTPKILRPDEVCSLGASGERSSMWVPCRQHEAAVGLNLCRTCSRCTAIAFDASGRVEGVHCLFPDDRRDLPAGPPRAVRLVARSVGDLMTRNVLCVRPDLPVDAAAMVFVEQDLSAMPVTDDEGRLLGLVTESDVTLRVQLGSAHPANVRDLMQPVRCAVLEGVSATRAAAILAYERLDRLVVVRPDGAVVGVLAASDLLAWLARADGYALPSPGPAKKLRFGPSRAQ